MKYKGLLFPQRAAGGLLFLLMALLPVSAAATIEVVLEGVEEELAEQVQGYIGEPMGDDGPAAAAFRRRAVQEGRRALEAVGYYNATIVARRERRADDGWRVYVQIDPGEPVRIETVELLITGDATTDPVFLTLESRLPIREGDVLHHGRYEAARRAVQNAALDRGYFDGVFLTRRVEVDPETNTAVVRMHYASGVRYRFGAVRFAESPLHPDFLNRLVPFQLDEPYSAEQVTKFNRALLDSNYFRDVRVRPRTDLAAAGQIPVDANLTMRARNEITTGVGFSTDVGARVRLGWRRPWANEWGHSMSVDSEIAQRRQNIVGTYTVPLKDPLRTALDYSVGVQREDLDDFTSERFTAGVQHRHILDSGWQRTISYRAERERFRIGDDSRRTTQLFLPGLGFSRLRSRGGVDPHWGDRQMINVEATDTWLGSDIELRRVRAGTRWLRTLGERHRVLLRLDGGALATNDFDAVPPSMRFYAGGDRSVRGYAYQSLGPEDDAGNVIGGSYLAAGSIEYGYQFRPQWRAALFADAGNAYEAVDEVVDEAKVGAGTGIRWISPIGPVRLDLAATVNEPSTSYRIHFSMGSDL